MSEISAQCKKQTTHTVREPNEWRSSETANNMRQRARSLWREALTVCANNLLKLRLAAQHFIFRIKIKFSHPLHILSSCVCPTAFSIIGTTMLLGHLKLKLWTSNKNAKWILQSQRTGKTFWSYKVARRYSTFHAAMGIGPMNRHSIARAVWGDWFVGFPHVFVPWALIFFHSVVVVLLARKKKQPSV